MRPISKINVNVIDLSKKEKAAFDYMQEKEYREDLDSLEITQRWGYVETPNGIYLLCEEGVGQREPVDGEHLARFEFIRRFKKDNGATSLEIYPCVGVSMNDEDLLKLPVKEVVTLDKFIRTFGSRLEANYEQWLDFLTRELKRPKKHQSAREVLDQKKEEENFQKSELAELIG